MQVSVFQFEVCNELFSCCEGFQSFGCGCQSRAILSKDDLNYMDLFHAIKEWECILLLRSIGLILWYLSWLPTAEKIVLTAETSEQSSHQTSILKISGVYLTMNVARATILHLPFSEKWEKILCQIATTWNDICKVKSSRW